MQKELKKLQISKIKENLLLTCEWIDCGEKFNDRSLYLSHINRTHVSTFDSTTNDNKNQCQWQGCFDEIVFIDIGHFQLHLSCHAYHNQLMNIGQQIINETEPKPTCYFDNSTRNLVADQSAVLICRWNDCDTEFYDVETMIVHTETHVLEDVKIPMMSKEKLKKIRYAKCQWINCQATFKKKSHLKVHLSSHTLKKYCACPFCGDLFANRIGFLDHCYRQETPTTLEPQVPINDFVVDENDNQSSIVIHLPHDILQPQTDIINSNNSIQLSSPIQDSTSKNDTGQNVALLVNFNSGETENVLSATNVSNTATNNVIQLQLTEAPPDHQVANIVREYQCTLCTKSFSLSRLLRDHMAKHLKKFTCSHCAYATDRQSHLREHILFRHSDNYDFECTFCGQNFKSRRILKRHIVLHQSQKNTICNVCSKSFTNSYSFKRHYRVQHLKEQIIFNCHICNKQYNRGNNLSRHLIQTHQLKLADGWSKFNYDKQSDGMYHVNPQCYVKNTENSIT